MCVVGIGLLRAGFGGVSLSLVLFCCFCVDLGACGCAYLLLVFVLGFCLGIGLRVGLRVNSVVSFTLCVKCFVLDCGFV